MEQIFDVRCCISVERRTTGECWAVCLENVPERQKSRYADLKKHCSAMEQIWNRYSMSAVVSAYVSANDASVFYLLYRSLQEGALKFLSLHISRHAYSAF